MKSFDNRHVARHCHFKIRPSTSENRCKLYPQERKLTKANQPSLKEEPQVISDHIKRFLAHDFLYVGVTLQTSRTTNKCDISTFNFGYPHLTLKEGPKVKSDHIKRFLAHDFL